MSTIKIKGDHLTPEQISFIREVAAMRDFPPDRGMLYPTRAYQMGLQEPVEHKRMAYTLAEFLKHFRISRTKAYQEMEAGRLRARQLGTRILITAKDADDWLKSLPDKD